MKPAFETNRSDTRTVTIDAPPDTVFSFVADPENLPRWAVGFCRSIRQDGDTGRWIAGTAQGEIPIRFDSDERAGTIDFYFNPTAKLEVGAFSRVIPNGAGSEYIFTQFQVAGMTAEIFEAQVRALTEELQVLRGIIQAHAACPV